MISATPTGPHSHSHPNNRGPLDLDTGRRHCMDSQKFLVPSLPVSTRLNPDTSNKKRERSIINGTGHTHAHEGNHNLGMNSTNSYQYHLHQNQKNQNVNRLKRPYGQENGQTPSKIHFNSHNTSKGLHHQIGSPNKDPTHPTMNSLYYQRGGHTNGDLPQRAHHQMPTNPSNYHHLSRSTMPVPCSSPAAASSASPKAISPAINGSQHNSGTNSYSSQPSNNVSVHSHGDLSLTSQLRFYPGGLPHPSHQMSFYAAAAAAAAAAGQHHALPYSLFPTPYAHAAAATSYLDNFHSSLLAQQQHEHLKSVGPSPSPPIRPGSGFHSRSPLASPNISAASLHTKYFGSVPESGAYSATSHGRNNMDNARGAQQLSESDNLRFASMLCSGLSKGGPLGLSHMDASNFHHLNSAPTNSFRQKEASSGAKPFNDERHSGSSISSKFWNIDASLAAAKDGRSKRTPPPEPKKTGQNSNHSNETFHMMNHHSHSFMNGKEGSLKHRILTRSPDQTIHSPIKHKMAETVFTFPDRFPSEAHAFGKLRENSFNHSRRENESEFLFPNPKKISFGQSSAYPSLGISDALPPTMPRPPGPIATTITTDSAKYLSQIQKPSMNSSMSSLESLPMYLSQNKSTQNLSSSLPASGFNNFASPTATAGHSQKSKSIPASPTTPTGVNGKVSTLPLEQMPVIHAFRKGSLIQLASGQLIPVEELRMEDFHRAAATMVDSLRIVHCKVMSIQPSERREEGQVYKVTLAVGGMIHHQVVMSTSPVQPLFVVGRGWASCSPEMTEKVLQLPCTHLTVGDICITLTKMCKTKPGRNGVKALAKTPTTKYKNSTNSILSTPPRRGSTSTAYASKILKVSNGGITKPSSSIKSKGNLSSPKSPTKVKFEENQVPVTHSFAQMQLTSSMLPPPSPVAAHETRQPQGATAPTSTTKGTDNGVGVDLSVRESHDNRCPKKRRWSAPDVIKDPAESKTESKQPKRPISHSPITTAP